MALLKGLALKSLMLGFEPVVVWLQTKHIHSLSQTSAHKALFSVSPDASLPSRRVRSAHALDAWQKREITEKHFRAGAGN